MVFGDGDFGDWLGHEGGILMNGISALIKQTSEKLKIDKEKQIKSKKRPQSVPLALLLCEDTAKTAIYEPGRRFSSDTKSSSTLIFTFPGSRI